MSLKAIPLYNGKVAYQHPNKQRSGPSFIPVQSERASVTMPQLRLQGDYPHRYTLAEGNVSLFRIYCQNKNGSQPSGDGSSGSPYSSIEEALNHAGCITSIARCYWVQVVVLHNSEDVNFFDLILNHDLSRVILGSTDGSTFFNISGINSPFGGIISQCNIKGTLRAETLIACKISDGAYVTCNYAVNCQCQNASSFTATHLFGCACDGSFNGATSVNQSKITLSSSESEHNIARSVQYLYDSEISADTEFFHHSLFATEIIAGSKIEGIKVSCKTLVEESSITLNLGERTASGVDIWGVSGTGDYILEMGDNSAVNNVTITGENKFQFTGSGRGYYGLIAILSDQNCSISSIDVNLKTSAVEKDDFSGTNQHWSIISYTCAHAVLISSTKAKCLMGCDYKEVGLNPEEGFEWATPCTELII